MEINRRLCAMLFDCTVICSNAIHGNENSMLKNVKLLSVFRTDRTLIIIPVYFWDLQYCYTLTKCNLKPLNYGKIGNFRIIFHFVFLFLYSQQYSKSRNWRGPRTMHSFREESLKSLKSRRNEIDSIHMEYLITLVLEPRTFVSSSEMTHTVQFNCWGYNYEKNHISTCFSRAYCQRFWWNLFKNWMKKKMLSLQYKLQ